MILHTVNKTDALTRCLALAAENDGILLIEDGIYAAMYNPENLRVWQAAPASLKRHILTGDLAARGLTDTLLPDFEKTDWHDFVALTTTYDKVISWG